MNLHTNISRKHWLSLITVMVIAALLMTTESCSPPTKRPSPTLLFCRNRRRQSRNASWHNLPTYKRRLSCRQSKKNHSRTPTWTPT